MIRTAIQPHEMSAVIWERAKTLLSMKAHGLDPNWVKEFDLPQLTACCARMANHLPESNLFCKDIQRELIQNPDFAAWLAHLLTLHERQSKGSESEGELGKPCGFEFAVRLEGRTTLSARDFWEKVKYKSASEVLGVPVHGDEVIEIDDGLRPCFFHVTEDRDVKVLTHFQRDKALVNNYEGQSRP